MGNTKTVGDTTEAVVLAEFMKAGIPVSVPFGENQRYDLIADVHGTLLRVQCKTGRVVQKESVLVFNATSHDGHRARQSYRNQADLFAVYSPYTQQVYVLDVNEVGETSVWLRLTPAKNNQEIGVRHAEQHTLMASTRQVSGCGKYLIVPASQRFQVARLGGRSLGATVLAALPYSPQKAVKLRCRCRTSSLIREGLPRRPRTACWRSPPSLTPRSSSARATVVLARRGILSPGS